MKYIISNIQYSSHSQSFTDRFFLINGQVMIIENRQVDNTYDGSEGREDIKVEWISKLTQRESLNLYCMQ